MNAALSERLRRIHQQVTAALLAEVGPDGHWVGELSSSALSTATAVLALSTVDRSAHAGLIRGGLQWLADHANADGGWGDTVRSRSNLSTTSLVWAAYGAAGADADYPAVLANAVHYLTRCAGSLDQLVPAIEAVYGKDRTFSVPITMTLALSGRLGPRGWQRVRPLPFELAALPRGLFGALRLPVVSYALPALIAIGQVIHHRSGRFNPLRSACGRRTLDVLTTLQPDNGGFLEATPLTSFVTMSLAGMSRSDHPVARRGVSFLVNSVRADGSWPIDTNLATWVTTLAVKALRHTDHGLAPEHRKQLHSWLLAQQYQQQHPYTGAAPGGWAWTDLPGGVPDADDTAGALLALSVLGESRSAPDTATQRAATSGVEWLLNLQNRDGGMPTFCRGWGTLPFDRSTPELTAHALRAWAAWWPHLPSNQQPRVKRAADRALASLTAVLTTEGTWIPLWFGHEAAPGQMNPVYGTAQVLLALAEIRASGWTLAPETEARARRWLLQAQHATGGWGGAVGLLPSVEETSLVLSALIDWPEAKHACERGAEWLCQQFESETPVTPTPIGLYFAQLWYFERLYPLVFAADALGRLNRIPTVFKGPER